MKTVIEPYSKNGKDYEHLSPVVEFLSKQGHESNNDFLWGNNRTGYFCHLKGNIDFALLRENFEFPDTVVVNEDLQTIDCHNTYSLIKGGF